MLGKLSKIVIMCYYASIFYLIFIKIFRILKIVVEPLHPLVGEECGVTNDVYRRDLHLPAFARGIVGQLPPCKTQCF